MAMSGKTTRKNIPFPKTTDPDTLAANHQATSEALDAINEGHQDFLQAGVVASTDWSFTANINSGTGALGSTGNTGGTAWLADPAVSGALMRSVTSSATLSGIAPSLLPASGKYVACAFELAPSTWGAGATVSAHSGAEKASQAEAEAAPPATTAGKMQVRRVIIKNTVGVYSIVAQEDVRPYATQVIGDNQVVKGRALWHTGDLRLTALPTVEEGWLACEGQEVSRTTYASLYAAIGTAYGEGNKSTTFNVPDFRGRSPLGAGTGTGLTARARGEKLGSEKLQEHTHSIKEASTNFIVIVGRGVGAGNLSVSGEEVNRDVSELGIEPAGEGHSGNMQPSTVCNVWIKT